jgi:hypothetical protein
MEITLVMPSMITLAENMRVRCVGKVLRVLASAYGRGSVVAVKVEKYEYLPDADSVSSSSSRIAALREHPHEKHGSLASNALMSK